MGDEKRLGSSDDLNFYFSSLTANSFSFLAFPLFWSGRSRSLSRNLDEFLAKVDAICHLSFPLFLLSCPSHLHLPLFALFFLHYRALWPPFFIVIFPNISLPCFCIGRISSLLNILIFLSVAFASTCVRLSK